MTLNEYFDACKNFRDETRSWAALDPYKFYCTDSLGGWCESCDNAAGGISVAWAFQTPDQAIEMELPYHFLRALQDELRAAIDNECDAYQFKALAEKYL